MGATAFDVACPVPAGALLLDSRCYGYVVPGPDTPRVLELLGYEYEPRFTWIAGVLISVGLVLLVWGWCRSHWQRRQRGSCRCPRCNYDLRGIVRRSGYPLRCSECALDIASAAGLTRPSRARWFLATALVALAAAHVTAMWPQVQRYGWIRLVPATALVLQPMNVGAWIDAQVDFPVARSAPQSELGRRLNEGELWAWQEWVLFKRVERSCRARDDDSMAPVRLDTARGDERSRGRPATASALIYDPSFLGGSPEEAEGLLELIEGLAAPESWIDNGGSVGGALSISGRVVVVAPARVHLEIEALLAGLEEAIAAGPPPPIPCELPENPRAFRIDCECGAGLLDNIRAARAMSSASLRSAGPTLDDGVTGDELDACRRAAFGLLDAIR